jgi:hypothetical protein
MSIERWPGYLAIRVAAWKLRLWPRAGLFRRIEP